MKSLSIVSVILAASTLLLSVHAGPVPRFVDELTASLERRASASTSTAQQAIAWLKNPANSASLNAKPICWCSGTTKVAGRDIAANSKIETFMEKHGCNTIDEVVILAGHLIDSNSWTKHHWTDVSKALAEHVKGTSYVLLGQMVHPESIWLKAEKPALMANHGVPTIKVFVLDEKDQIVEQKNLKG